MAFCLAVLGGVAVAVEDYGIVSCRCVRARLGKYWTTTAIETRPVGESSGHRSIDGDRDRVGQV